MDYLMYCVLGLGAFEIVSNAFHLSKGSITGIGQSAKRQHQELPLDIADAHFFIKALIMLGFGLIFVALSGLYFLTGNMAPWVVPAGLASFSAYGFVQAAAYRRTPNVWLSALVYSIPLAAFLFLHVR
ncbi:MAG: hypothetical protein EPN93_17175 [Spirochaetes bacterium]|nr:MAG: hypothetical protein EPN93_17175 [Spirochaetota bacterium]